jgi:hypothetical protein
MGSTRPFAHLASLAVLALSLVVLLPDCASACMCAVEGGPKVRAREAIAGSDAVFSGEVVELEKEPPDTEMVEGTMLTVMGDGGREATVTLRVSEVWKGPTRQTVRFTTPVADGISCAHPFKEGREYLVFADGERDLEVGGCSETKPLSGAEVDLALLGNGGERPQDGAGKVLSDTSGGLQTPVVIGLAGLAAAGSLLLAVRLLRAG